jgi:GNAT superfamily N-acetyltransferase
MVADDNRSQIQVRDAVEADLPALMVIKEDSTEALHRDRLRDAQGTGLRYLVLVVDHAVIGFACLVMQRPASWPDADDTHHLPQIVDLQVHPAHRGQGYGSAFVGALERIAAAAGYRELYLSVDPVDNPRAYALYQRLGYQAIQTEPYRTSWEFTDSGGTMHRGEEWSVDMVKQVSS